MKKQFVQMLVTGKTFVLEPHKTYEILQATPQQNNDRYYKHPNYISHRLKGCHCFYFLCFPETIKS